MSGDDSPLRRLIDAYISVEAIIQQITNPSGSAGKSGLGEPKFNINGSVFSAPWGRPQRGVCGRRVFFSQIRGDAERGTNVDGPALRASAMIQYAEWLLNNGNSTYVERLLWPAIQLDLDYVATYWRESTSANPRPSPASLTNETPTDLTSGKRSTRSPSLPPLYSTDRFARALYSLPDSSDTPKTGNTVLKLMVSYALCGSVSALANY